MHGKKNSPKEHKRRMAETNIPALNRHAPIWLCTETFPSSGSFLEERWLRRVKGTVSMVGVIKATSVAILLKGIAKIRAALYTSPEFAEDGICISSAKKPAFTSDGPCTHHARDCSHRGVWDHILDLTVKCFSWPWQNLHYDCYICTLIMPVELKGSCHCGAVRFSVESSTPVPYQVSFTKAIQP